jgi:hypothetical protein
MILVLILSLGRREKPLAAEIAGAIKKSIGIIIL